MVVQADQMVRDRYNSPIRMDNNQGLVDLVVMAVVLVVVPEEEQVEVVELAVVPEELVV